MTSQKNTAVEHKCKSDIILTSMPPQYKCSQCGKISSKPFEESLLALEE